MHIILLLVITVTKILASENRTSSQLGLLCGWSVTGYDVVLCDGLDPLRVGCPQGYTALVVQNSEGYGAVCVKAKADSEPGKSGTWCGFPNEYLLCGDPDTGRCPTGYRIHQFWNWCFKVDSKSEDLRGTLCGISTGRSGWQPDLQVPCGGMPSVNQCPAGFTKLIFQRYLPSCYLLA